MMERVELSVGKKAEESTETTRYDGISIGLTVWSSWVSLSMTVLLLLLLLSFCQ